MVEKMIKALPLLHKNPVTYCTHLVIHWNLIHRVELLEVIVFLDTHELPVQENDAKLIYIWNMCTMMKTSYARTLYKQYSWNLYKQTIDLLHCNSLIQN